MTSADRGNSRRAAVAAPKRSLLATLGQRRRLRDGLITLLYVLGAVALTVALSYVTSGPRVNAAVVAPVLGAVAGGMLVFTGLVFSLLLLVVQFGSTTFTPRLNLFRDDPFVRHAFAFFVATVAYCLLAALDLNNRADVSVLVPILALLAALAALALFRGLQLRALRSIQLAPAIESVASRGWEVLERYYQEPYAEGSTVGPDGLADGIQVRWLGPDRVIQQIDLAGLVGWTEARNVVVAIMAPIGSIVTVGEVVAIVHGEVLNPEVVLSFLQVGLERTFDADPLFAFRLLSDITVRALSPTLNDPATAIQVLSATQGLLRRIVGSKLDESAIHDHDDQVRVLLTLPAWPDFLAEALDETALAARTQPTVLQRLAWLLDDLDAHAPAGRRDAIRTRSDWVAAQLAAGGPLPSGAPGGHA
jgi:uncharacterized membrane protein